MTVTDVLEMIEKAQQSEKEDLIDAATSHSTSMASGSPDMDYARNEKHLEAIRHGWGEIVLGNLIYDIKKRMEAEEDK